MQGFKKCPNGHYYKDGLTGCPYCPKGNAAADSGIAPTQIIGSDRPTEVFGNRNDGRTRPVDGFNRPTVVDVDAPFNGNHTVFGDDVEVETPSGNIKVEQQFRSTRKLVGWLVTYSHDTMGADYKLYEGRNIIGRDMDCGITVADKMMSGKHAVLLFRSNQYSLTDTQSSHGTFVNDEDIELELRYLKDGDIIKMGSTVFKFRISL